MTGAPDPREANRDPLRAAAVTMHTVRDQCVWTQQITHRDLVPYLVEESAELIDAVEDGSRSDLREELGDLLWQVLFHSEIASRDPDDPFDIDDVARGLTDKMVRRHPHVFGSDVARTPDEVLVLWNAAKAAEKHTRTSVLDGVSERMPSLALAHKLLGKAAGVGVGVASASGSPTVAAGAAPAAASASPKPGVHGETGGSVPGFDARPRVRGEGAADAAGGALHGAMEGAGGALGAADAATDAAGEAPDADAPTSECELGDALLALVATARANGWDAERALRERLRVLEDEIRAAER